MTARLINRMLVRQVCDQGILSLANDITFRALAPVLCCTMNVPLVRPQELDRLELLTALEARLPFNRIAVHQLLVPDQTRFRSKSRLAPRAVVELREQPLVEAPRAPSDVGGGDREAQA